MHPCLSDIRYVRLGRLTTKSSDVLPPNFFLGEGGNNEKELRILHLNSNVSFAARARFLILLTEAPYVYIKNRANFIAFQVPSFHQFDDQLQQDTYDVLDEVSESLKPISLGFMNVSLTTVLGKGRSTKQPDMYHM